MMLTARVHVNSCPMVLDEAAYIDSGRTYNVKKDPAWIKHGPAPGAKLKLCLGYYSVGN